jgi:hypothetical protein
LGWTVDSVAAEIQDDKWIAVRSAAKAAGLELSRARLRATRVHHVLERIEPVATAVTREGLSRRDLEHAMAYLSHPEDGVARVMLRG